MHPRRNHTPQSTSVCAQQLEGRVCAVIWQDSEEDGPCVLELHDGQRVRCEEGAQRIRWATIGLAGRRHRHARMAGSSPPVAHWHR